MTTVRALMTRVSATLRQAGLPVPYAGESRDIRGRDGIRVGNPDSLGGYCCVHFDVYEDPETERELSDKALAVLLSAAFDARRDDGRTMLTVYIREAGCDLLAQENTVKVAADSDLNVSQPTHAEWHIEVDGKRGAYSVRRSGTGEKMRYKAFVASDVLAKNMPTLASALDAIRKDLGAKRNWQ